MKIQLGGAIVYAVGDVHGCYGQLLSLERQIEADAAGFKGRKLIVMLGDYIDRGPESAQVIEHLLQTPPEGFHRICLAGNHEAAFLDYLEGRLPRDAWLAMGGGAALRSYGMDLAYLSNLYSSAQIDDMVRSGIPQQHRDFLRTLPIMAYSRQVAFVHAGIRPGLPLERQDERDILYIRDEFFDNIHLLDRWVIHGHTPVEKPELKGRRLNIDTGAYMGGPLTAVQIGAGRARFFTA
ncbi:metallophosphoesterase family protein [Chelativorans sp. AA-79]|uniref:metallophosphoesterase family protein n=1 Tax=Chelativorans sp. AA-79 TaxID=3028735 RepID=UPI0023F6AD26|nr:metallophosphoesterase family protein [Chelativorans sp. AA-79]WEX08162.1 metallophosphoesterase family protein [Chelativorans sp. AA-79]